MFAGENPGSRPESVQSVHDKMVVILHISGIKLNSFVDEYVIVTKYVRLPFYMYDLQKLFVITFMCEVKLKNKMLPRPS